MRRIPSRSGGFFYLTLMEFSVSEFASMLMPGVDSSKIESLNRYGGFNKLKRIYQFEQEFYEEGAPSSMFNPILRRRLESYLILRNRLESGKIIPSEDSTPDDIYIKFLQGFQTDRFLGKSNDLSDFDFFNAKEMGLIYEALSIAWSVISKSIRPKETVTTRRKNDGKGYVYVMHNARNGYHKIGMTRNEPTFREKTLQSEEPEVELIFSVICEQPEKLESYLHEIFADKRVRGEWFDLNQSDLQEIFEMSE